MLLTSSLLRRLARPAVAWLAISAIAAAAPLTVTVRRGDTLWALAERHGTTVAALKTLNGLRSDRLDAGQTLKLPAAGSTPPAVEPSPAGTVQRASHGKGTSLVWPLSGRITDRFGQRGYLRRTGSRVHTGLDVAAPTGTPIVAATGGRVTRAGWDSSGFGLLVVVRGTDGRDYYYGHASKLLVRAGQTVAQGQRLALVGSTGASTGPHLHFEVRADGVALNPLPLLPAGGSRTVYASSGRR